ncbi:MAG: hypothetical protein AMJ79_12260 [Phycisphaerae bacterium SM23_30]|nr:MAG: hypothetical protein AMJ79_12260 [Phycisphaerae bacterium SM23_30]
MEDATLLAALLDLAENAGIEVRREALGGEGGGLCLLRGRRILFVDAAAVLTDQIARTAEALADLREIESSYLLPQVRECLEKYRPGS